MPAAQPTNERKLKTDLEESAFEMEGNRCRRNLCFGDQGHRRIYLKEPDVTVPPHPEPIWHTLSDFW